MEKNRASAWFVDLSGVKTSRVLPKTSSAWATGVKAEPRNGSSVREFQSTTAALPQSVALVPPESLFQPYTKSDVEPIYRRTVQRHLVINSESSSVENTLNTARLDELQQRFSSRLLLALKQEPFEVGVVGQADKIVKEAIGKNALATLAWLNELYVGNFHRPAIAADLLALVSRIPYPIAGTSGMVMAIAGLSHKNGAVQEAAIRSFENWASPGSLQVLESVQPSAKWLADYLEDVKRDLKGLREASC